MPERLPVLSDTTVFVTTIGDQLNFADCLAHLSSQSVACRIETIDHVSPLSAAMQAMLDRGSTEFHVQVDEDMILFPNAIETLHRHISTAPENVAMVCGCLWDCDAERAIHGVKIYRARVVKQFPYNNVLSCEADQLARMKAAGYRVILHPFGPRDTCLGEHGKHYSCDTIFSRWQRSFQKQRQLGSMKWVEPYAARLLERYVESGQNLHLYAFLGAIAGIVGTLPPDEELDARRGNEAFELLKRYFPI